MGKYNVWNISTILNNSVARIPDDYSVDLRSLSVGRFFILFSPEPGFEATPETQDLSA